MVGGLKRRWRGKEFWEGIEKVEKDLKERERERNAIEKRGGIE